MTTDKPNLIESVTPCSGQYSLKKDFLLNAWLLVSVITYLVILFVLKQFPTWTPLARGLLSLLPLIPGLLYVRSWLRFVRGLDELQRRIQTEAFLIAALGTLVLGIIVDTLSAQGVKIAIVGHGLGFGGVVMGMFMLWLVGGAIAQGRYK